MASNLFFSSSKSSSKLTAATASGSDKATNMVDLFVKRTGEIKNQALGKTLCVEQASPHAESVSLVNEGCVLKSALSSLCRTFSPSYAQQLPPPPPPPPSSSSSLPAAPVATQSPPPPPTSFQFIDPSDLMRSLYEMSKKPFLILLDCRPYTEFNNKHIKDSVHLNCRDKLIKKRLQMQKITIRDLISCELTKSKLDSALCKQEHQHTSSTTSPPLSTNNTNSTCLTDTRNTKAAATTATATAVVAAAAAAAAAAATYKCQERLCSFSNTSSSCPNTSQQQLQQATDENLIVIYDDTTSDDTDLLAESNPLKIVQENIIKTGIKKECRILKGGFKQFAAMCPDLCNAKSELKKCMSNAAYYEQQEQHQSMLENTKMTEITPYLYLGNEMDAKNVSTLAQKGIRYILNVTKNIPFYEYQDELNKFVFKRIPVDDCLNQSLKEYFDEAFKFIDEAKQNGSKVLVHCQAGVSRSPTIVIAYLMRQFGISLNDAFNRVRDMRPIIAPNIVFMSQLMDYDAKLKAAFSPATRFANSCSATAAAAAAAAMAVAAAACDADASHPLEANTAASNDSTTSTESNKSPIECN